MANGARPSVQDIKSAINRQFETHPACKVEELVGLLGISKSTAKRYASEATGNRKSKIRDLILKYHEDGHTQEETEEELKKLYRGSWNLSGNHFRCLIKKIAFQKKNF